MLCRQHHNVASTSAFFFPVEMLLPPLPFLPLRRLLLIPPHSEHSNGKKKRSSLRFRWRLGCFGLRTRGAEMAMVVDFGGEARFSEGRNAAKNGADVLRAPVETSERFSVWLDFGV